MTLFSVDTVLRNHVGAVGLFQILLAASCGLVDISTHIVTVFIMGQPHYRCKSSDTVENILSNFTFEEAADFVGPSMYTNRYHSPLNKNSYGCYQYSSFNNTLSQLEKCTNGYIYKLSEEHYPQSLIADWNLVCDDAWKTPFVTTMYMIGMMLGYVLGGQIGGFFGIRRSLIFFTFSLGFSSNLLSLCPNYPSFVIVRMWSAFSVSGTMNLFFVLLNEMTLCQYRSLYLAISFFGAEFLNHLLMVKVAMDIDQWRYFNFYSCLPVFLCLLFPILLPESPRWLMSQSRPKEAMLILYKGYRINQALSFANIKSAEERLKTEAYFMSQLQMEHPLPRYFTFTRQPALDTDYAMEVNKCAKKESKLRNIKKILVHRPTFYLLLKCIVLYTLQILVYFGLMLYARLMKGSIYFTVTLYTFASLGATILSFLVYRIFRSRKKPVICLYTMVVFTMLATGTYLLAAKTVNDIALVVGANIGYVFMMTCHVILFIYVAELFPSDFRAQATGLASGMGRIGATICDFVNELDSQVLHGLPLFVYSGVLIVQLGILFTLKDITGENLQDFTISKSNESIEIKNKKESALELM